MLGLLLKFLFIQFFVVYIETLSHLCDSSLIPLLLGPKKRSDWVCLNSRRGHLWRYWVCPHTRHILLYQVLLELSSRLTIVPSVINVKDKFAWADCLHKFLKFAVVTVGAVGHFIVERHISVVLVVPPGQNDEHCRLLLVALVNAILGSKAAHLLVIFKFADMLHVYQGICILEVCCK